MTTRAALMMVPLVLFVAMAIFLAGGLGKDPSLLPSTRLQKPLPEFSLPALDNPERRLARADIRGPALLNVWGVWCPACRIEHPVLMELSRNGIPIYGLNYKDVRETALAYLAQMGNPFRDVIFDEAGSLGFDLGVYGAPETYLIDADGLIYHRHVGEITVDMWRNDLWPRWQQMTGQTQPPGAAP